MFRGRILRHALCSLFLSVATAAYSTYGSGCNDSLAVWTGPGLSTTVTIPVDLTCDMAVLVFADQDPINIDIAPSCNSTDPTEQTFEIQLSETSPLGNARMMFLCGELSDTFCLGLRLMESDRTNTQRISSNNVRGICASSQHGAPPSQSTRSMAQSSSFLSVTTNYTTTGSLPFFSSSRGVMQSPPGATPRTDTLASVHSSLGVASTASGFNYNEDSSGIFVSLTHSLTAEPPDATPDSASSRTLQEPPPSESTLDNAQPAGSPSPGSISGIAPACTCANS
jgi:hypothetical protein